MTDKAEVAAEISSLRQAIVDDQVGDQAVVDKLAAANVNLQQTIDDLKANGNAQEAADLEEILAQIKDAKAAIQPVNDGSGTPAGETEVPQ